MEKNILSRTLKHDRSVKNKKQWHAKLLTAETSIAVDMNESVLKFVSSFNQMHK
jgi:hypothetical protein